MTHIHNGPLDLFPKWEVSWWEEGEMRAYAFSKDGLWWKCRTIDGKSKTLVYSKKHAQEWVEQNGAK